MTEREFPHDPLTSGVIETVAARLDKDAAPIYEWAARIQAPLFDRVLNDHTGDVQAYFETLHDHGSEAAITGLESGYDRYVGPAVDRIEDAYLAYGHAYDRVNLALVLSFEPDAIRSHFEDEDTNTAAWVAQAPDEELRQVGQDCVSSDVLYDTFRSVLRDVIWERMSSS